MPRQRPEEIVTASTENDYAAFATLVRAYIDWCRARYHDDTWFVETVFGHQSLDDELTQLATKYGPPQGKTLLALRDGQVCGAGAYRRLADGSCEMKRLFVDPAFQGRGIGRQLCAALIDAARADGFTLMRLDTANRLTEAIRLYTVIGFTTCAPYCHYPSELMPYLIFMELPLD